MEIAIRFLIVVISTVLITGVPTFIGRKMIKDSMEEGDWGWWLLAWTVGAVILMFAIPALMGVYHVGKWVVTGY